MDKYMWGERKPPQNPKSSNKSVKYVTEQR